ncbi:MAG: amidase [Pseudonocardiales bacterium]|jgi:amidase|nr:amidase [Pseudonocardiales bacterium]
MTQTAAEIAAAVRAGDLTARTAVEQALSRIENTDAGIGAYQEVRVFAALREADAVDERPDRRDLPLAGVPIAIKDNVPVQGEPMRVGSAGTDPAPQQSDHEVVRRLRAAGAVVVGLTRVPELCIFGTTDSTFGITRNPWDTERTPGGSSGGSAAAVAAGTVPLAHSNDGMGSIRIPAACCGLVGIKPGSGVVPADLGNGSWFGMAENGPLATTVEDAALMLSVLADRPGLALLDDDLRVLRIAVSTKVPAAGTPLDKHWAAATRESGDLLDKAGHVVVDADPPYGQSLILSEGVRWVAGTELDARLVRDRSALAARTRRHAAAGRLALAARLPREKGRRRWQERAEAYFVHHDVLITPTLAQPPVLAKAWAARGWLPNLWSNARYAPFAAPWNLAGWPAMSVPAGLDPNGLPLAVQLVGRPGTERLLLGLAAQLERLRPWPRTADLA